MKMTGRKLSEYWDGIIYKNLPPYAKFRKMKAELEEHFNFIGWSAKRIILPLMVFYALAGLFLEINVFGSMFLSLLLFFYSNLLPDVDALFKKAKSKNADSLWYEKYSLLFFAPVIMYYIICGRAKPLYAMNERPFHNFKTMLIYGAFLFVVGSIFWSDALRRIMFPLFGMLGFATHLIIDKNIFSRKR
ncbi:MAG: hypothetical protein V1731_02555 [Candidatus Aenigmatarchaeota archaeon]